jgi:hypothetical protein
MRRRRKFLPDHCQLGTLAQIGRAARRCRKLLLDDHRLGLPRLRPDVLSAPARTLHHVAGQPERPEKKDDQQPHQRDQSFLFSGISHGAHSQVTC